MSAVKQYTKYLEVGVILGVILGLIVYTAAVFYYGKDYGESKSADTLSTYLAEQQRIAYEANIKKLELENQLEQLVFEHTQELLQVKQEYESNKMANDRAHTVRVQQLETRERSYQRMSQASDSERRALADAATRLDRTLTEGRQLVEELRHTLALRDKQLKIIGEQISAERTKN